MTHSQNQDPENSKRAQVQRHCKIPGGFDNAMSRPSLQLTVFTQDIRDSGSTFRDMQADESTVPWSKAA